MRSLRKLWLNDNKLVACPTELGSLTLLEMLSLSRNPFDELCLGIGYLTKLKDLQLDQLNLKVPPREIKIRSLEIRGNRLSRLPRTIGGLNLLSELHLDDNELRELPQSAKNLQMLVALHINNNQLDIWPPCLQYLTSITELFMNRNTIEFVPPECSTLVNLRHLEVSGNRIYDLPPQVGGWTSLTTLKMDSNRLPALPETLGQLSKVESLSFANNNIITFPMEVGSWHNLRTLDLSKNDIRFLPSSISNSTAMRQLFLEGNPLIQLPLGMGSMRGLRKLSSSQAVLSRRLDLSGFTISVLPKEVIELTSLTELTMRDNNLKVVVSEIEQLPQLELVDLSSNRIKMLPATLGKLSRLRRLDVRRNRLKHLPAMIPREISFCTLLKDLQLDGNRIQELPIEITRLSSLARLKLNDNCVSVVPEWIGRMSSLRHLSLGNNRLQHVPYSISLLNLAVLTLDGNPLDSIETGVLMGGAKGLLEHLRYNHNYDIADRNLLPDVIEQRRQVEAYLTRTEKELQEIEQSSLEAELKVIGGLDQLEIARNKRIGEDRTATDGAVILDQEMLDEVRILAERERAGAVIFSFLGPGLTGNKVRMRAKTIFYELDEDNSGTLDLSEFRKWLLSLGADISTRAIESFMEGIGGEGGGELELEDFQQLVYLVYQVKS
ncbi:hypothetical protein GUITHDRAFT_96825 [Guillardia theta CCMP2712]|uniref:EF-hand domain-containing protein n=1 Tax=Guillardia theta (strain CCMP2712) TaxID=905079 RepID=L1IT30_GUITC|nr:hypothetical protein GUITHDRAFT_96825 [Guillardia theta CCMP2712]EKX39054.1 hypothetical protein GUITHDRAFT_96825 [Guillardia theta CCMP2712]|eukprot:XP_005826034.1 hypothetical protein GUITHDRAFT_96825 [Guillardia theta CCMP2712]